MRPPSFRSHALRQLLLPNKIATWDELQKALGAEVDVTVFRKLKPLDYLSSYSHRGRYYTLRELVRFGADGLWSLDAVGFSRHGTLLATAETFVQHSPKGYFAEELAGVLSLAVPDALRRLVQRRGIARQTVGLDLYTSTAPATRQRQLLTRRRGQAVPSVADASVLEISPDELKAAIIVFYSLLDEQQRRLQAALESLKWGHGGDRQRADCLGLDPPTVARGRQQLRDQDVEFDRVRSSGGGRKRAKKKRPP